MVKWIPAIPDDITALLKHQQSNNNQHLFFNIMIVL